MGRVFGIGMLVVALWVGAEIYSEGVDGAFGGALARFGSDSGSGGDGAPVTQRAGRSVDRAFRESERRYDTLLED